jgi:MinD-like ATPase involved in chromosome partitioning or flagellar assembly
LVDMAPLAGHASLMLNLRPTGGLRKALETEKGINSAILQPYWQAHDSGVQVLSSPVSPVEASEIPPKLVNPLVATLRQAYQIALLDLPPHLSGTTSAALASADRVLLVISPELASLQSTAVTLQALGNMGVEDKRIWLVLNAPGGVGGLSPEAVAQTFKRSLAATIPYEPGMLAALNARRPLMLASPKSAAAQSIARLASELLSQSPRPGTGQAH